MRPVALAVVAALAFGACSADHRSATATSSPALSPRPAATRPEPVNVNRHEADRNGLHYTLTLDTPTVTPFAIVRETIRVDNHTRHRVALGRCVLGSIAVRARHAARPPFSFACGAGITVEPGASYTYGARTMAPSAPGTYVVFPQPVAADAPPRPLLAPIAMRVVARGATQPAPRCTQADLDARGVVPMPPPQIVTHHETVPWISVANLAIDPPTDPKPAAVTARQAWHDAQRLFGNSPLATYDLTLGMLDTPPVVDHRLAWLITAHNVPMVPSGGPQGVTGPTGPACYFYKEFGTAIDATNGNELGIASSTLETH